MLFAVVSHGFKNEKKLKEKGKNKIKEKRLCTAIDSFAQLETVKQSKTSLRQKSFILITSDNFDETHLLLHYSKCLDHVTLKNNHSSAN